jgi:hypothetical protein
VIDSFALPGIPPVIFWVFVGTAVVIQGISKSGFAGGAGILSLPLMMLVMRVDAVAAVLLPLLILCDMNAIYHHRHNRDWVQIWRIYVPAVVGIVAGAAVWWWIGKEGVEHYGVYIKRFVGVIALVFAAYILAKETALRWALERYRPGWRTALAAGLSAGFCSTIAHAAGPIVSLYMFAQDMGKVLFVGTVAWTFTLINLTKLPFYLGVGLIDPAVLQLDLLLVWLIPLGSFMGKRMHDRVSETLFNRVILVLTVLAAVQLLSGVNVVQWVLIRVAGS